MEITIKLDEKKLNVIAKLIIEVFGNPELIAYAINMVASKPKAPKAKAKPKKAKR